MEDIFLTKIIINKVRHLSGLEIPLSETERKHLILTGKNGSGKTSVLEALRSGIDWSNNSQPLFDPPISFKKWGDQYITFFYSIPHAPSESINYVFYYSGAKRSSDFKKPKGPSKIDYQQNYQIDENAGVEFLQHMVNITFDRLMAKEENDQETALGIDKWYSNFEKALKDIFEEESLKLEFDKREYNFNIISQGKEKFDFNTLSQGYSAILNVVTNLMMRMEGKGAKVYDVQGIALIDEIETHLHIALQKKILPFLTKLFPRIQFIVTTHSPFVLNSISNAVVYDLEKQILVDDMSGYSSEAIVESYFDYDKYSAEVKGKLSDYEQLVKKEIRTSKEEEQMEELTDYFEELPMFKADELAIKVNQIKLAAKNQ